jgi:hypothetical protein
VSLRSPSPHRGWISFQGFIQEKELTGSVWLRPAANLSGCNVEAVLLDAEETSKKRLLFG